MFNFFKLFLKSNNLGDVVKRQVIYSFLIKGISVAISFLYVPLLIEILDQERYGIWVTLITIINWFTFFDIGLGNGLRNYLTIFLTKKDYINAKKYIATTYFLISLIFGAVLLLFLIVNPFLNWQQILNTTLIDLNELFYLTLIVFSLFLVRFVFQLIGVILLSDLKTAFNNSLVTIGNLLSFILIYSLHHFGVHLGLLELGTIISFIPLLVLIITSIILFYGRYSFIRPSIKDIDLKVRKDVLNLGTRFFVLQLSAMILFQTSNFVVIQFYGPEEVTQYSIIFQYFQFPIMVIGMILSPIWSAVTTAYTKHDYHWLKRTLAKLNYISILFCVLVILMVIFNKEFFMFWIGNKISINQNLIFIMAIQTTLVLFIAPYSIFINGFGKVILTTRVSYISIPIFFLLIFGLNFYFKSSVFVVISIILTTLTGYIVQFIQVNKILNKKAQGVWNL